MSKTHSPTHFNGDIDSIYYPEFNVDINKQMRVPKSIRVNEDYINENSAVTNTSTWNQMSNTMEKLEMHVPERILVVGKIFYLNDCIYCIFLHYKNNLYNIDLVFLLL